VSDLLGITTQEMIVCVAREIEMRRKVYPRWVEAGRMKLARAEREIEVMEAVLARLKAVDD
jgi:uncharacterized protein YqeY